MKLLSKSTVKVLNDKGARYEFFFNFYELCHITNTVCYPYSNDEFIVDAKICP